MKLQEFLIQGVVMKGNPRFSNSWSINVSLRRAVRSTIHFSQSSQTHCPDWKVRILHAIKGRQPHCSINIAGSKSKNARSTSKNPCKRAGAFPCSHEGSRIG